MGREVRRVPADWQHPVGENGRYIPMFDYMPYEPDEIEEGINDGWLDPTKPNYGVDVMPQWPEEERTHYQMYEDTSEGTPISPVMESPEALSRWLVDNNASAFANRTASYEEWLHVCQGNWAPGLVIQGNEAISDVEFTKENLKNDKNED